MGKDEFAGLLEGMINDAEIAGRVEGGDFTDLSEGELSPSEQALLSAAASELGDDVAGFGNSYLKLGDIDGMSKWKVEEGEGYTDAGRVTYAFDGPKMGAALNLLKLD